MVFDICISLNIQQNELTSPKGFAGKKTNQFWNQQNYMEGKLNIVKMLKSVFIVLKKSDKIQCESLPFAAARFYWINDFRMFIG